MKLDHIEGDLNPFTSVNTRQGYSEYMVMDIAQQQDICWMSRGGVITIFIILQWSIDEGWDVVIATQQDIQHMSGNKITNCSRL